MDHCYSSKCKIGDLVIIKNRGLQKIYSVVFIMKGTTPTPHYNLQSDRAEGFHSEIPESDIESILVEKPLKHGSN